MSEEPKGGEINEVVMGGKSFDVSGSSKLPQSDMKILIEHRNNTSDDGSLTEWLENAFTAQEIIGGLPPQLTTRVGVIKLLSKLAEKGVLDGSDIVDIMGIDCKEARLHK